MVVRGLIVGNYHERSVVGFWVDEGVDGCVYFFNEEGISTSVIKLHEDLRTAPFSCHYMNNAKVVVPGELL